MAYSSDQRLVEKLDAEKTKGDQDLRIIRGPFSLRKVYVCLSTLVNVPISLGLDLKEKFRYSRRRSRNASTSIKKIIELVPQNIAYPKQTRLEEICEIIGKEIDTEFKEISVPFAGLVYHFYADVSSKKPTANMWQIEPLRNVGFEQEFFERNHFDRYILEDGLLYIPVRLYIPTRKEEFKLPIRRRGRVMPNLDSYVGGLIELSIQGKNHSTLQVYISPANRKLNKFLFEQDGDLGGNIRLGGSYGTYLLFFMPPNLTEIKNTIVDKYRFHNNIVEAQQVPGKH